jgi:NodT family efflux transporter outer membrane factor (OMF) lipoprotein
MRTKSNRRWIGLFGRAALAAFCVGAGGCAVGPTYHRPEPAIPAAFKEAPPEGWKAAQPNEGVPRGPWWDIYNDAQLTALEAQVSISNQNVIAAMAQYREARDEVRIARGSLFPTVTAPRPVTSTSGRFERNLTNTVSGAVVDYTMPVDVSYQADVWGSIRRSIAAGAATAQASAADLENARLTYQAQLAVLYFQLHGLDSDAGLLQTTLTLYGQYLQLTKDRFDAGVVSGADVAQAETQLNTTRTQLIGVGVARAQYEHAIAILIGKPPSELSIAQSILPTPPPPIPAGLPSALLERRPISRHDERTVAAANERWGGQGCFLPDPHVERPGFRECQRSRWLTWPSGSGPSDRVGSDAFEKERRAQKDLEAACDAAGCGGRGC